VQKPTSTLSLPAAGLTEPDSSAFAAKTAANKDTARNNTFFIFFFVICYFYSLLKPTQRYIKNKNLQMFFEIFFGQFLKFIHQ
jgi:hypothetical protein